MNRKEFIQSIGIAGLGLGFSSKVANATPKNVNTDCVLVPSETAVPFPLDLTDNSFFLRKNIREEQDGIPLRLRMRVLGADNCRPMQNVRVHIWHCNNLGQYSGYDVSSNPDQDGLTYHRGYQITDANGEVEFLTQFPGIYPGRICHIHFQVYVNSNYSAVSQFTFDENAKNQLYLANPSIYQAGEDPLSVNDDGAFRDSHEYQLASLEFDSESNEWRSDYEVAVEGSGITNVPHREARAANVIEVFQNYPNPFSNKTQIPILLKQASRIKLELWDLEGKMISEVYNQLKNPGKYNIKVNFSELGLASRNYIYRIEAQTANGSYSIAKMMTCSN